MSERKNIFVIIGSASGNSSNEKLMNVLQKLALNKLRFTVFKSLKSLPHFDPELSIKNTPQAILDLRNEIQQSHGVIICTPEYVFSIPSGLKNAIEWCVSTTVFSEKPTGIITASADGTKGHAELLLIMKTVMARLSDETSLLIHGVKGRINEHGEVINEETLASLTAFIKAFIKLVNNA